MQSLRLKFVLFAMAAVSVLLLILGISINGLAWYMFEQQTDEMMETLIDSDGNFMQHRPDEPEEDENKWHIFLPPEMDVMRSARFFIVHISGSGSILFTNIDQIFFVSNEEAVEYAERAIEKGSDSGRIDRYKFAVKET